jgi:integrase
LAVEEGLRESAPLAKLYKEHGARDRSLSEDEYSRLLEASSPHLRRLLLCAYETGMRAGEIKRLIWDKVDFKTGFIRLSAEDTKTNEKRAIPISATLRETLEAIRKEQREGKVASLGGHVFPWKGKPMTEGGRPLFMPPVAEQG